MIDGLPLGAVETDAELLTRLGVDPEAWAKAYAAMPHDREQVDKLHLQLTAWFGAAIRSGRVDGLRNGMTIGAGPDEKRPLIGICQDVDCGHRWVVVWLPMEMETAARVMQIAACPLCGNEHVGVGDDK